MCSLQLRLMSCFLLLQAVREGKPALWGAAGGAILVAYGFVPTAQPILDFGRIYAGEAFSTRPHPACCYGFVLLLSKSTCTAESGIWPGAHSCLSAGYASTGQAKTSKYRPAVSTAHV